MFFVVFRCFSLINVDGGRIGEGIRSIFSFFTVLVNKMVTAACTNGFVLYVMNLSTLLLCQK